MNKIRKPFAVLTFGIVWFLAMMLFFVFSGAQNILANPEFQSDKFIKTFFAEPFPRAAESFFIVPAGLIFVGAITAVIFCWLNEKINYGWFKKGLIFGGIHWALMIPWFEFYLPFNVMREPFLLVLLEMLLWLGVTLTLGIYLSFVLNFKNSNT